MSPPRLRRPHVGNRLRCTHRLQTRLQRVKGRARAVVKVAAATREQTEHDERTDNENASHAERNRHSRAHRFKCTPRKPSMSHATLALGGARLLERAFEMRTQLRRLGHLEPFALVEQPCCCVLPANP